MLTPLDIHKKEFRRAFRGYNEEAVDMFLDQLAKDYEELYAANLELKDQIEKYEKGMARYNELEDVIKETLIMAQKNADDLRSNTEKETQVMLHEAKVESDRKIDEVRKKSEQILWEAEKKALHMTSTAENKTTQMIFEAEAKVREAMKEYENLCNQVQVFKIKFRSFLESQLQMLDGEPLESFEMMPEKDIPEKSEHIMELDQESSTGDQEELQVV